MNLLAAASYDPSTAVSKSTASLLAMTAIDTTNLRLAVTVPAHGIVRFYLRCVIVGATTFPQIFLGVLNGATVVGRVAPTAVIGGTALATTRVVCEAWFTATGLAAGAANFDAAYGVEIVLAATNIKYGGPNNTTTDDAWGAFVFEAWDPRPLKLGLDGGVNITQILGTAISAPATAGILDVNVKNINNVAAATPGAANGILISGSNAGTTTLGALTITGATTHTGNVVFSDGITVSAPSTADRAGVTITGNGAGAGISTTGGATGQGIKVVGGGTSGDGIGITTTSGHAISAVATGTTKHGIHAAGGATTSHGINAVGGGVGHGILATSGGGATGDGIRATAASSNGNGINAIGIGTGAGQLVTGGATGIGFSAVGGATSGSGMKVVGTNGNAIALELAGQGSAAGMSVTGGATGIGLAVVGGGTSGDGIKVTTTSGHGINLAPVGTDKHGFFSTGGNGGTSDGMKLVAGTGGVDLRAAITGSITGSLSGSVGSVTGLTASDVGAIKTKTDFLPSATAGASGGLLISGSNAGTTTLAALTITGNMLLSDGLTVAAPSTLNRAGITITGNGSGAGIKVTGGATGHGLNTVGGGTSGDGFRTTGGTSGTGITATGAGSGNSGMNISAQTSAAGITIAGASSNGVTITGGGNGHGIAATGAGSGHGMIMTGGATGDGIVATAAPGSGSGHGITATGVGTTKHGINATGGGTSSDGIRATGGGIGHGMNLISGGGAPAHGLKTTSLAGGSGIFATGEGVGDGITATAGASGVDIRGNITGSVTGSLSGSVGSVAGNVGGNVVGTVASVVGNVGGNVVGTVASVVGNVGGNVVGTVASVVGNVGGNVVGTVASVVGNVGGNVVGSTASVVGNVGGNVVGSIGALTAGALADFFTVDSGETYASSVAGSVVKEIADNAGTGTDPWSTALPGAYGAGTAGFILGTNLDTLVSSRLAPTTAGRTLDITATGAAGIDWGNVENVTTAIDFTQTTIKNLDGNTVQTGDSFARIGVNGAGLTAVVAASVTGAVGSVTGNVGGNVVGSVGSVTGNVGGNVVGSVGSVAGLNVAFIDAAISSRLAAAAYTAPDNAGIAAIGVLTAATLDATVSSRATPAQVNAEVLDVLTVDTFAEPGQEVPAATNTLAIKIGYTFKAWRNKSDQTSSLYQLYADGAAVVDQKAVVSDNGTIFVREEVAAGP